MSFSFLLVKGVSLFFKVVPGLILLVVCFSWLGRRRRYLWLLGGCSSLLLLVLCSPYTRNLIVYPLESKHQQVLQPPAEASAILVLSAGHSPKSNTPATTMLNPSSLARLTEGVRLWKLKPDMDFYVTGDRGFNSVGNTQASVMGEAAQWMGVAKEQIVMLHGARNTETEILLASEKLQPGSRMLLVTAAVHMPRAMTIAERYKVRAVPSPTHFMANWNAPVWNLGATSLLHIDRALHEYVGMIYFWLKTRWLEGGD